MFPKHFIFTAHFQKKNPTDAPLKKNIVKKVCNEKLNLLFINIYNVYCIGTNQKKKYLNEMDVVGVLLEVR